MIVTLASSINMLIPVSRESAPQGKRQECVMLILASSRADHSSLPSGFNYQVSIQAIRTYLTPAVGNLGRSQAHAVLRALPLAAPSGTRRDRLSQSAAVQHASSDWLFRHSRLPGRRRLQLSIAYDAVQPRQAACLTAAASRIASVPSSCSL